MQMNKRKRLKILFLFLWLIAIHSFIVGLCLIFFPADWLNYFGFNVEGKFFSFQGGIFHIVLVYPYIAAIYTIERYPGFLFFSVFAKFTATLFLISYYLFGNPILVVLLSGIGDMLMGIMLWLFYRNYKNSI